MTRRLSIPEYLRVATERGGPSRSAWLAALPTRVDELAQRWGLRLGEPFEPGGACAWVAPASDGEGRDLVLKVTWVHSEALHEAEGLAALAGAGAVEVVRYEHVAEDATAMLLERCRPGTELRARPEAEQHAVLTELLRSVWAVDLPSDHPFRPLSVMAEQWVAAAAQRFVAHPERLDPGLARAGLDLFVELASPAPSDVLLLTDLHAGNVLAAERRPWLLVDPKPYVGDRHYDVTQHLLNCNGSLQADPLRLLGEVADRAGLDAHRVREWLFARCVQERLDGSHWEGLDAVARAIAPG